jgi:hypothetical protein
MISCRQPQAGRGYLTQISVIRLFKVAKSFQNFQICGSDVFLKDFKILRVQSLPKNSILAFGDLQQNVPILTVTKTPKSQKLTHNTQIYPDFTILPSLRTSYFLPHIHTHASIAQDARTKFPGGLNEFHTSIHRKLPSLQYHRLRYYITTENSQQISDDFLETVSVCCSHRDRKPLF